MRVNGDDTERAFWEPCGVDLPVLVMMVFSERPVAVLPVPSFSVIGTLVSGYATKMDPPGPSSIITVHRNLLWLVRPLIQILRQ